MQLAVGPLCISRRSKGPPAFVRTAACETCRHGCATLLLFVSWWFARSEPTIRSRRSGRPESRVPTPPKGHQVRPSGHKPDGLACRVTPKPDYQRAPPSQRSVVTWAGQGATHSASGPPRDQLQPTKRTQAQSKGVSLTPRSDQSNDSVGPLASECGEMSTLVGGRRVRLGRLALSVEADVASLWPLPKEFRAGGFSKANP